MLRAFRVMSPSALERRHGPSSGNKKTRHVPVAVAVAVERAYRSMSVPVSRIVGLAVAVLVLGMDATSRPGPRSIMPPSVRRRRR